MASQKQSVLDYLENHEGLTQLIAFTELGICRLSERIRELEFDGFLINHDPVEVPTRSGKTARVMCYSLNSKEAYG